MAGHRRRPLGSARRHSARPCRSKVRHVAMVRRFARPHLGPLRTTRWSQLPILQAVDRALVVHRLMTWVRAITDKPRRELSVLLDPALDYELARLPWPKFGSQSFFYDDARLVVHNTDVRMRSEQVEPLRQGAERDHAAVGSACSTSNYDLAKARWPSRTRSGGMRTFTGPSSSTFLAPSRQVQPLKMALHNLLWSAASPDLPQEQGPRIAHAAHGMQSCSSRSSSTRPPRPPPRGKKKKEEVGSGAGNAETRVR